MLRQGRVGYLSLVWLACVILVAWAGAAWAEPAEGKAPGRVLLVVDRPNDPFLDRIRAEVTSLGFLVIAKSKVGSLETDAREQKAVAAIRVLASRKGVEVWMADAASGRSLLRQVIVDERPEGPDHGVIAMQTAELLRTGLLAPPPPPADPSPPPPRVVPPPPLVSETSGQAGFGMLYSPGGVAVSPMVFASLQQLSGRGLGLSLDFGAAYRAAAVSAFEGQARFLAFQVGAAGLWRVHPQRSAWAITSGLGLALARIGAQGDSKYGSLVEQSSQALVGMGYGRIFLGRAVTSWLNLGLGAMAGATFQRMVFRFAGFEVATFGWPMLSVSAMAEVH